LSAAARLLFALGRAGLSPSLAVIDAQHRTPARAVVVCTILALVPFCISMSGAGGGRVQPGDYYGYLSTIATLALILVYGAVTVAESVEAARLRRVFWALLGAAGAFCLAWSLVCSIVPVPAPPANLWPVLVLAWVGVGVALPMFRPKLKAA
jgi:amino acid transporter